MMTLVKLPVTLIGLLTLLVSLPVTLRVCEPLAVNEYVTLQVIEVVFCTLTVSEVVHVRFVVVVLK